MYRIKYDTHITQRARHGVLSNILVECIRKGLFTYDMYINLEKVQSVSETKVKAMKKMY